MTNAAVARVRLFVWCKGCQHQVEPDPAEMATRYGAETSVLDWRERPVCSKCGSREVDMVVIGTNANDRSPAAPIGPWPWALRWSAEVADHIVAVAF